MKSHLFVLSFAATLFTLSAAASACGGEEEEEAAAPTVTTEAAETAQPTLTRTAAAAASPTVEELACSDPQPPFVTDFEVRQTPPLDEPQARIPFRDPVFGTCLVRATDRKADLSPDDPSPGLKNEYSRVQSFNADGSRILVRGIEATWYLYDAHTLQPLAELPLGDEPRWDASDPNLIYFTVPDEIQLMSYNVQTAGQTLVHDFADDFPGQAVAYVWTHWEGRPSSDSRYWGLMANDVEGAVLAFLVYDRQTDQVIAKRDMRGVPGVEEGIDHVTISPLGNYFMASFEHYCERGQLGDDAHPCGLMVYDRNLTNGRSLLRIIGHYDPALDGEGREVIIFQDIDQDNISLLDLASGTVTPLWPIDFSHTGMGFHFSGCAFNRPGWALVSTHSGGYPTDFTWMDNSVFAIELKPNGRVLRLAHTHSVVDVTQEQDYWAEPHASVNQDFTRVVFTSNWGRSGTGEVEMFMIELPPDWPERLP